MLDVVRKRGVAVVDERSFEPAHGPVGLPHDLPNHLHRLVDGAIGKLRGAAAKEAQLGIGPVTAVAQRASQKMVEPRDAIGAEGRFAGEEGLDFLRQLRAYFFIGVEREDPVAAGVGYR